MVQDLKEETFEDRIKRWYCERLPMLRSIIRGAGRVPQRDVEDVAHNVFLKALPFLRKRGVVKNERAWLRETAYNESMVYHRKRNGDDRRRRARTDPGQSLTAIDPTLSDVIRIETERAVREALASLPSKYRDVIEACDLRGMTLTEFAERAGIPRTTAKGRRNRGRCMLRERLQNHAPNL